MSPKNSPDDERITRLENGLSTLSVEVSETNKLIARQTKRFERELSSARTVKWRQVKRLMVYVFLPIAVGAAGLMFGVGSLFYSSMLPKDIEVGIAHSPYLKAKFDEINERLKRLEAKVDGIGNTSAALANASTISSGLKDATSGQLNSIEKRLPDIKNLLGVAKTMRIELPDATYRTVSKRLFGHYLSSSQPLRRDVWNTLINCASTRTFTDAKSHPISAADIELAKSTGNYFEGAPGLITEIDLSSQTEWKGAIFKNCKITISKPERGLNLTDVRFVDCEFEAKVENVVSARLIQTVLETKGPRLDIPNFKVLKPYYDPKDSGSVIVGD